MKLFPAIDLRALKVVRLQQGDFAAETVYGDDPVEVALAFEAAGAKWLHMVDLDAAKTASALNRPLIADVVKNLAIPVQCGGGVRDRKSAEALLDTGVSRIVLGTVAIEQPTLVTELATDYPDKIAVGLDARGGKVAARGWRESSQVDTLELVRRYSDTGVAAFIVTDIERDGMLGGSDVEGLRAVLTTTGVDVIASGGVGTLDDLRALREINVDGKTLAGAIVGKALYDNRFTAVEAVNVCEGHS